jgi:hypothetical protein
MTSYFIIGAKFNLTSSLRLIFFFTFICLFFNKAAHAYPGWVAQCGNCSMPDNSTINFRQDSSRGGYIDLRVKPTTFNAYAVKKSTNEAPDANPGGASEIWYAISQWKLVDANGSIIPGATLSPAVNHGPSKAGFTFGNSGTPSFAQFPVFSVGSVYNPATYGLPLNLVTDFPWFLSFSGLTFAGKPLYVQGCYEAVHKYSDIDGNTYPYTIADGVGYGCTTYRAGPIYMTASCQMEQLIEFDFGNIGVDDIVAGSPNSKQTKNIHVACDNDTAVSVAILGGVEVIKNGVRLRLGIETQDGSISETANFTTAGGGGDIPLKSELVADAGDNVDSGSFSDTSRVVRVSWQ